MFFYAKNYSVSSSNILATELVAVGVPPDDSGVFVVEPSRGKKVVESFLGMLL
jgi:hypothetical protein